MRAPSPESADVDLRTGDVGTLPAMLLRRAREIGDRPAMRHHRMGVWETWSWSDYADRAAQIGMALTALGVEPGDRVAIHAQNRPEWLIADLGAQGIGAAPVGIYPTSPAAEVEYLMAHSEATVLIAEDEEQLDKVLAVRERLPALRRIVVIEHQTVLGHLVRRFAEANGFDSLSGAASQTAELIKRIAQPGDDGRPKISVPLTPAPPTPWNRAISPHRRLAMRTASLDDVKALKNAVGVTVNDVVMAVCAGALREYLIGHDALPDSPLRAMVPVSIRTGEESDPWTNRVSALVAELPTDCADPIERMKRCHEAMATAKREFELVPADSLIDLARFSAPVVATAAARLVAQQRLADRFHLPSNVVISNVPGPRQPLYFAGAKMRHQFPVSIVTDDQGLNITVQSYLDRLDFGFIADRELVPDLADLADLHVAEIDRLLDAVGLEPTPTDTAPADAPPLKQAAKKKAPKAAMKKANRAAAKTKAVTRKTGKQAARKKAVTKKTGK